MKVRGLKNSPTWETYKETLGALNAYEELFSLLDTILEGSKQLDQHRADSSERSKRADRIRAAGRIASPWYKPPQPEGREV